MLDAVRLGDVASAARFIKEGAGPEHKNGNLYLCEAVCGRTCSREMLDLLMANGGNFFEIEVSGRCAIEYVLQRGNLEWLTYMHGNAPEGFANMLFRYRDRYITVTEGATMYPYPDVLAYLFETGGTLPGGSYYIKNIIKRMWTALNHPLTEARVTTIVKESAQCVAACELLGQNPFLYIGHPDPVIVFELYNGGITYPAARAYHQELAVLMQHMALLRTDLYHLKNPVFQRNSDVWRYAVDRRVLQAWAEDQKQAARRCYAALYHGESETAQGRVPIRALCDADTVRELLTLFLVFPKRRLLASLK